MSAGSFCWSPSITTTTRPAACSKPALMPAVWPKFLRNSTTFTRSSRSVPEPGLLSGRVSAAIVDKDDLGAQRQAVEHTE